MSHKNPRARLGHDFRLLAKFSRRALYFPFSGGALSYALVKQDRKTLVTPVYTPAETVINENWAIGEALIVVPAADLPLTVLEQDVLLQVKVTLNSVEYFWPDTLIELRFTGL